MWIRSQNKRQLSNVDSIWYTGSNKPNDHYIYGGVDGGCERLGAYKSEERALGIIDEIQERILGIGLIKVTGNTTGYYPIVYEMPKE
jgi:hypothetical protein